jgi:peptidyl-prolyl cis-trans isomerase SurA
VFAEREPHLLRDLIDQQLLVQRAHDLGLSADTDVIRRLDEIRQQMNLETMEEVEQAAAAQGVSFEDFKLQIRNGILTQRVIGREVGGNIQITQEEVRKFYEENQKQLDRPERVRLSEILIPAHPEEGQSEEEALAAAEARTRALLEQIRGGASFEELARQHSTGPTAAQGGDLGYFERGMLAQELEDLTFGKMKVNEVSDVVRTRQGYIILKVTQYNQAGVPPLKEVERQIHEHIYVQKLQPALRVYLTKLREDAYIDLKEGVVDSGASPNQTKPTIVAARDEEEQEQKKKKRFLIF